MFLKLKNEKKYAYSILLKIMRYWDIRMYR